MKMINEEMRNFSAFPDCYNQSLNVLGNKSADRQFINCSKLSLNSYFCLSNSINSLCIGLECSVCLCAVVWSNVTECDSYRLTMRNQFKTSCKLLGWAGLGWAGRLSVTRRGAALGHPAASCRLLSLFYRTNIFGAKYFCYAHEIFLLWKFAGLSFVDKIFLMLNIFVVVGMSLLLTRFQN